MRHRVTLIPGDGIGPSVIDGARRVIEATGVAIDWDLQLAGQAAATETGSSLPDDVMASIRRSRVALKGPTATGTTGERAVSVRLRAALDLSLGVRPVRGRSNGGRPDVDVLLLRMLGEDLYAGLELEPSDPAADDLRQALAERGSPVPSDTAFSLKPMSSGAVERFAREALAHARARGRCHVTIVHKATVMRATDGRFRAIVRGVADELGGFEVDERLVDSACLDLIRDASRFDVLLAPVQYGDILSDVLAGLAGGLGLVPGANLGPDVAVFEPVHGTAPRLTGSCRANPIAAILTGAMLLRHLDEGAEADRIERAVDTVLGERRVRTYDLLDRDDLETRPATTDEMADAVIAALPLG